MNPQLEAAMKAYRAQGATDEQVTAMYNTWMAAHPDGGSPAAPAEPTPVTGRDVGRSFTQGLTFNFGDELGLTDRAKEKAFQKEHPWVDLGAKIGGGVVAPAAAVMFGPEALATAGGAAALGAAGGMLGGIGDGENAKERLTGGLFGAAVGGAGGLLGYGATKLGGKIATKLAARFRPGRAVGQAAKDLLGNEAQDVAQRMADVNKLAPGGSSIASAATPRDVPRVVPRFGKMAASVGDNPEAAAQAETDLLGQRAALKKGAKAIGTKMGAVTGDIPDSPELADALTKARGILGARVPEAPPPPPSPNAIPGLQQSTPFSAAPPPKPLDVQALREIEKDLGYRVRMGEKRGTEANGATLHQLQEAKHAVTDVINKHFPVLGDLGGDYGTVMGERRAVNSLIGTVRGSRAGAAAADAGGSTSGNIASGAHSRVGIMSKAIDALLTDKKGAAAVTAQLILKPGGPDMVQQLLSRAPGAGVPKLSGAARAGLFTALPPALKGLLFQHPDSLP